MLGQAVPYWPSRLRQTALIEGWAPGQPEVVAAATPDLDVSVLLRMAAVFPRDHPAAVVLTHLVQVEAAGAFTGAKAELDTYVPQTLRNPDSMVVAAPELDRVLRSPTSA